MSKPIALIFGSGPNVGYATVRTFLSNGYRVVQTSRSVKKLQDGAFTDDDDHKALECDVNDTASISRTFETVRAAWGQPSVIVYNAARLVKADPTDPFSSLSTSDFEATLRANVVGLFQAIKEAVVGFKALPEAERKAFFFTGNNLNELKPLPGFSTLGAGKSAAAYLVADADNAYQNKGYRFYYVDERFADGRAVVNEIDGQAHADYFYGLVKGTLTSPWWSTFVKGEGYVKFPWNR
ncbi:hypothetical protein M409DRAFT_58499 [Zasmidium cellare ATCC 36951]|uniref:NAD(P)-binding domain-containing protein n=1 Tax=Zasmidium cellare ATCC 36951 TaxID=1080233 RepID=A0A6A6C707_ZASCE|nr:uncharacterized protein M409DRAFT_58499 [Zasmidium cellare ATCC 36951]KAF2162038.1 hypothetical protein M409DRAFT_58499 [Zasmidium cellare ATCC 36951]